MQLLNLSYPKMKLENHNVINRQPKQFLQFNRHGKYV